MNTIRAVDCTNIAVVWFRVNECRESKDFKKFLVFRGVWGAHINLTHKKDQRK